MSTPACEPAGWNVAPTDADRLNTAAAFLRNVVREPAVTCRICATPVRGFDRCWRCEQMRDVVGIADVVAPLMYAITGTPSADLVYDYKNHPARGVRASHGAVVSELVRLALSRHGSCFEAAAGLSISRRLVIPSLTNRPGHHPFSVLMQKLEVVSEAVRLLPAPEATCDRAINDKFVLAPNARLDGQHVLILDDVWTTGSNAQSAALAVRRAGAAAVSVLVVSRWLSPRRRLTAEFIAARLNRAYDPDVCPVTGGKCR